MDTYAANSDYASQLGFLLQFVTHGLLPACTLQRNQLANSLQGWGSDESSKEKPTFLAGRKNTPFKRYERGFNEAATSGKQCYFDTKKQNGSSSSSCCTSAM